MNTSSQCRWILALTTLVLWLAACTESDRPPDYGRAPESVFKRAVPEYATGHPAPDFALRTIGGIGITTDTVRLSDYRGTPVVLNFWRTTCAPCVAEHSDLNRIAEQYRRRAVTFLGIVGQEPAARVLAAEKTRGLTTSYPNLHDTGGRVSAAYNAVAVPLHVVIDSDGTVVFNSPGGPIDGNRFRDVLDAVLAGEGARAGLRYQPAPQPGPRRSSSYP